MKFDIVKTIAEMLAAVMETVKKNIPEVRSVTEKYLGKRKERFEMLAQMRITGELTQKELEKKLEGEKLILESELCAIAAITQAIARRAARAAIHVLLDKIKLSLPGTRESEKQS